MAANLRAIGVRPTSAQSGFSQYSSAAGSAPSCGAGTSAGPASPCGESPASLGFPSCASGAVTPGSATPAPGGFDGSPPHEGSPSTPTAPGSDLARFGASLTPSPPADGSPPVAGARCSGSGGGGEGGGGSLSPPALQRQGGGGGSNHPSEDGAERIVVPTAPRAAQPLPPINLTVANSHAVHAAVCGRGGFAPLSPSAPSLPDGASEDGEMSRLWATENGSAVDWDVAAASGISPTTLQPPWRSAAAKAKMTRAAAAAKLSEAAAAELSAAAATGARPATEVRSRPPRGAAAQAAAVQSAELDAAQIISTFPSLAGAAVELGVAPPLPTRKRNLVPRDTSDDTMKV